MTRPIDMTKRWGTGSIKFDLRSPIGNCYGLASIASQWITQCPEIFSKDILTEMMASDYLNVLETFEKYFGDLATLYFRDEDEEESEDESDDEEE